MRDPSEVIAVVVAEMRTRAMGCMHSDDEEAMLSFANELASLSTPQPASADVDDAMVERACAAIDAFNRRDCADKANDSWVSRPIVRAGLLAAIKGDSHAG